jgi:hypothetical protein
MLAAIKALPLRVLPRFRARHTASSFSSPGPKRIDPTITVTVGQSDIEALLGGSLSAHGRLQAGQTQVERAVTTVMALLGRMFSSGTRRSGSDAHARALTLSVLMARFIVRYAWVIFRDRVLERPLPTERLIELQQEDRA